MKCFVRWDVTAKLTNKALYDNCHCYVGIKRRTDANLSRVSARIISSLAVSLRLDGELNVDATDFQKRFIWNGNSSELSSHDVLPEDSVNPTKKTDG